MKSIRELTEIALFAALGVILDFLSGLVSGAVWLFGGSISLGVIPIFIISFRRGMRAGLMTGLIVGTLQLIIGDPFIVHPVQFILDYPLAYTVIGLAGVMSKELSEKRIIFGVFVGMSSRFIMHFISGIVFFKAYAEDQPVVIYSFVYNLTYLLPTLILSVLLILAIYESNSEIFETDD